MTTPPPPNEQGVSLAASVAFVAEAADHLTAWYGRQTDVAAGRSYVAAAHDCIAAIDDAIRTLHDARTALVGEIRRDAIDRAARVDELLDELAAERAERAAGETYGREDPVTNGPLPDGVQGWPMGRAAFERRDSDPS